MCDPACQATLTFDAPCPHGAVFHGFAGYFRAVLFGDVTLSSCPEDRTPRLQEWLPVYVAFQTRAMATHTCEGGGHTIMRGRVMRRPLCC